jgi:hypothetical protein
VELLSFYDRTLYIILNCLVWLRPPLALVQALVRLRVALSRIRECK